MLYRETGQFKSSYAADMRIWTIRQDRFGNLGLLAAAVFLVPLIANDYWLGSILIPFLIFSLAALGLNILTGYAGQISLGTGGFMAVGAFATYNLVIRIPDMPLLVALLLAGFITAAVGILFGLPSLRIKGFYLAVATLAAQFFIEWLFTAFPWFVNYDLSGVIKAPPMTWFGIYFTGPEAQPLARYYLVLGVVLFLALMAKNMVRCSIGRSWMAIRDMDIAAEIIGIRPFWTKLSAFAISSFYCGVAGALWAFLYIGTVEPQAFDLLRSFEVLFMVIIGGLGSIFGSFLGAAFIVLLPVFLNNMAALFGGAIQADMLANLELMIFGGLIIFFLIVEPLGLARLWQIGKEKLRLWPFPY